MAAPAVSKVVAGKPLASGGVLSGPIGTTLPTDAVTAPDAAIKALGYASEDGLTEATERSTEKIKAWGGDIVKVVQSEFSVNYSFTLMHSNDADALKVVYGDANVATTAATASTGTLQTVQINGDELEHRVFVFDMKDGKNRIRIVVPNGQVTEVGEVTYDDGGVVQYQVTVEAFEDESGNNAYKYIDDGVFSA